MGGTCNEVQMLLTFFTDLATFKGLESRLQAGKREVSPPVWVAKMERGESPALPHWEFKCGKEWGEAG